MSIYHQGGVLRLRFVNAGLETPPGQQAQADWGHLGYLESAGGRCKIWGFVLTPGNSRGIFADVWSDQKLETLLRMHEEAFRQLGGVPQEILYDPMKTLR